MATTLNFTLTNGEYISDEITPSENAVTLNVVTSDDKIHNLVVEHSINGIFWQFCGNIRFCDGTELTVDGLRKNAQKVRFHLDVKPKKAEWC